MIHDVNLESMEIEVLLDLLLDAGDNLKDAQERLRLFQPYSGLEKRYATAVRLASEEIEALRKEIKRRCYKGTL